MPDNKPKRQLTCIPCAYDEDGSLTPSYVFAAVHAEIERTSPTEGLLRWGGRIRAYLEYDSDKVVTFNTTDMGRTADITARSVRNIIDSL